MRERQTCHFEELDRNRLSYLVMGTENVVGKGSGATSSSTHTGIVTCLPESSGHFGPGLPHLSFRYVVFSFKNAARNIPKQPRKWSRVSGVRHFLTQSGPALCVLLLLSRASAAWIPTIRKPALLPSPHFRLSLTFGFRVRICPPAYWLLG